MIFLKHSPGRTEENQECKLIDLFTDVLNQIPHEFKEVNILDLTCTVEMKGKCDTLCYNFLTSILRVVPLKGSPLRLCEWFKCLCLPVLLYVGSTVCSQLMKVFSIAIYLPYYVLAIPRRGNANMIIPSTISQPACLLPGSSHDFQSRKRLQNP